MLFRARPRLRVQDPEKIQKRAEQIQEKRKHQHVESMFRAVLQPLRVFCWRISQGQGYQHPGQYNTYEAIEPPSGIAYFDSTRKTMEPHSGIGHFDSIDIGRSETVSLAETSIFE